MHIGQVQLSGSLEGGMASGSGGCMLRGSAADDLRAMSLAVRVCESLMRGRLNAGC